jgi:hypothetical protein
MTEEKEHAVKRAREALKTAFPATRFSVAKYTSNWFQTTYGIRWCDGPQEDEVVRLVAPLRVPQLEFYYSREKR